MGGHDCVGPFHGGQSATHVVPCVGCNIPWARWWAFKTVSTDGGISRDTRTKRASCYSLAWDAKPRIAAAAERQC